MHFEKNQLDQVQKGRQSSIIHFHIGCFLLSRARWLDHYYKTKCVISGEDASWKKFYLIKFKMAAFSVIIHFHMADIW